jgi:hypothetical protein
VNSGEHCYLVAAYASPSQFARLAEALAESGHVIAHVDAKANLQDFVSGVGPDVHFTPHRLDVVWGSYGFTRAMYEMIETAKQQVPDVARFTLLSGDSFPLLPGDEIARFFKENSSTDFLDLVPMPSPGKSLKRLSRYHIAFDPRRAGLRRHLLGRANQLIPRNWRKVLGDWQPYGGSGWWSLTRSTLDQILATIAENPRLERFYRHTNIPDEHLFQTIVANTLPHAHVQPGLMWVEFAPEPRVGVAPRQITLDDVRRWSADGRVAGGFDMGLYASRPGLPQRSLFARKFNDAAEPVVDAIRESWSLRQH